MTTLWLSYQESESGGDVCAGQEDNPWPIYEDTIIDVSFQNLSLANSSDPPYCVDVVDTDKDLQIGDEVSLVIVRYRDGGTFASTSGYWKVMAVCTKQTEIKKEVNEIEISVGGKERSYKNFMYAPWQGYFACLEGVEVHTFILEKPFSTNLKLDNVKHVRH